MDDNARTQSGRRTVTDPDWITTACEITHTAVTALTATEHQALIATVLDNLGVDITARAPWDAPEAPPGQRRSDGWQLVARYAGNAPCLMFLEGAATVWRFRHGEDLARVLAECPPGEFFVCDEAASYLLCSNHHDVVIGWGAATAWVDALAQSTSPS